MPAPRHGEAVKDTASPYENLPDRAFWRTAVTNRSPLDPGDMYQPRFPIGKHQRIVTAGSCFAQHVGRSLRQAGFNVLDRETVPDGVSDTAAQQFGYRLYSARYGNIYTVRQLVQLLDEVEGSVESADPVWEKDGRYFDAFRPGVEPDGLPTPQDVQTHRQLHLDAVRAAFRQAEVFVFTFGLTEAWRHKASGTVYPTAPGTIAGTFDPERYEFVNYGFAEILADFETFRQRMLKRNPDMRFVITTSPVPLTATATRQHVEVATSYSKSVLRAVCGELYARHPNVDYFPSYEIITSANNRGVYFEPNKRSVSAPGVATAMRLFLEAQLGAVSGGSENNLRDTNLPASHADDDVICEEALLDAFAR